MFNKIQTKIILLVVFFSLLFIIGLLINKSRIENEADALFEIREKEKNVLFDRLFALQSKSSELYVYDYTYWDEMVNFVKHPAKDWAAINIEAVMPTYNMQYTAVYDTAFTLVYNHNLLDSLNPKKEVIPTEILKGAQQKKWFNHFFLQTDFGLLEVRTAPIQPGTDIKRETTPQGHYVSARLWTDSYISELSNIVECNISIVPMEQEVIKYNHPNNEIIVIERYLNDYNNNHLKKLIAVSAADEVKSRILESSNSEFIISFIFAIVLILMLFVFLLIWVSNPLKKLSYSLKTDNTSGLTGLKKQKNEFGVIANLIERFLSQNKELINEITEHVNTKQLLEHIASTSPALITVFDVDKQRNIYQNRSILSDLGYSDEDINNITNHNDISTLHMVHEDDNKIIEDFYNNLHSLKDDDNREMEYRIRNKHGEWQWIRRVYSVFQRDENGYPTQIVSVFENITNKKLAEEELIESEEKFRMLTETVPALIMIYQDNKIKYMNRSSYKILEIQDEGWIGKNFWEIMHADSQEGIRTRGNERMNSSNPNLRYEFELKTLSGKEIWLDVSGGVIDYKGKKAGFVTAYDITDRKRAEIVIQNSRNFYLSLFDEFPTLIWKTNKECKVDYYNKTWLHFRGITLEKELSNGWGIAVHPEDLDRTDAIYEEATKERRPFRVEYRLKHHTGEYKWVLDIGRPFYEIDGAFGGYIGTCLDINDQKALEESLKISEQYYKNLFESAHDAIIIFRPEDEMILDVNEQACKIYGFSREEMLHMSLKDVSEDIDRGREMIKDTLDKNFVHGLNTIHRTKFGNKMFIESNGAVINFKNEKAILAINRDVTSKKQAENQILSSLKEKEILLKEVHHRVKNNLQVISSLLKLQSEYINDKNDREIFRESQNRVRTMALIHEKLYRSHDLARIDFGDYVQNLTSSLLLTYNVNKHKIKLKYNIEKIFFDVDTAIPCGLLINELVSNCIKHAFGKDDSGEIKIELYTDEDNCYSMIVKDNGKGFPETVDFRNTKTLGMQLVVTLADQLDAVVSMDNHVGTSFLIKFKEIKYKERASKVN